MEVFEMKKKLSILLILVLVLSLFTPAQGAVKTKKVKLKAGTTVTEYAVKGFQKISLNISGASYTWKSTNKKVATVSKKGKIKLISRGSTKITATRKKKTYTLKLNVETPYLSRSSVSLFKERQTTISVIGTKQKVSYKSSNKTIATVTSSGRITGVSDGTCYVTATIAGAVTLKCVVSVRNLPNHTVTPTPTPTPTPAIPTPTPIPVVPTYMSGNYRVGIDIPSGTYVFYADSDKWSGYFCESTDANKKNIIENENFSYNDIYTITDGNYLELSRCHAIPISYNPHIDTKKTGSFIVGKHIPAGTYRLTCTSNNTRGYFCIYENTYKQKIIANDNFTNNAFCTVEEGQLLLLSRCVIDW